MPRGFASLSRERHQEIIALALAAKKAKGWPGHKWTSEEAREASRGWWRSQSPATRAAHSANRRLGQQKRRAAERAAKATAE